MKIPLINRSRKYDFPDIEPGEYRVCETESEAVAIYRAAKRRGLVMTQRTVDGEIRLYRVK